jgi:hypothetical protein
MTFDALGRKAKKNPSRTLGFITGGNKITKIIWKKKGPPCLSIIPQIIKKFLYNTLVTERPLSA